jgi:hypothetical protein
MQRGFHTGSTEEALASGNSNKAKSIEWWLGEWRLFSMEISQWVRCVEIRCIDIRKTKEIDDQLRRNRVFVLQPERRTHNEHVMRI